MSVKYRHRVIVRTKVTVRLGLASKFGICTTTFGTNDTSDDL